MIKDLWQMVCDKMDERIVTKPGDGMFFSKGLVARLRILGFRQGAFDELLRDECVYLYAGEVPADADTPLGADVQCIARMHPTGSGFIGDATSTGTATYYRWGTVALTGDSLCVQGLVGRTGEHNVLALDSTAICSGTTMNCSAMTFGFGAE